MCAIAGIVSLDGRPLPGGGQAVRSMLSTMAHRGPDSSDIVVDPTVSLGVNRLSILDHDSRANQPFVSLDNRFVLVFNGEIYNFRDLKKDLVHQGYSFSTRCDTEVLIALYHQQRSRCLSSLRGMFAFAVWDRRDRSLFLARDRFGEKPLVYYQDESVFAFASELPGLLTLPRVKRQPDPAGLHMAMYYMHAPAPYSPFVGIRKLEPAHYLEISTERHHHQRYWRCAFDPDRQIEDREACQQSIRECLDDAVSVMSRSDAPVGALLSGGLDSSAVVASMSRVIRDFPTFRIGSGSTPRGAGEQQAASEIARRYAARHHEYEMVSTDLPLLEAVVRHHGEPIATPVAIDAYVLAREMNPHVKVALCGAGADELFGGYRDHRVLHILDNRFNAWKALEEEGRAPEAPPDSGEEGFAWELYNRFGRGRPELIFPSLRYAGHAILAKLYSEKMQKAILDHDPIERCIDTYRNSGADGLFNAFIHQQLDCVSQYSTAEINDRMGMAHSIEIRSPFLDVRVVELACRIPARFKVGGSMGEEVSKQILREAMQDRLPSAVLHGPKLPYGGTIPYDRWLRKECAGFVERKLESDALADSGLYNMPAIQEIYLAYQCGAELHRDILIGLISTAIWMEQYL